MSDVISFRFNGEKDDWSILKSDLAKQGKTLEEYLSSKISQDVSLIKGGAEENIKTASRYEDELTKKLENTDLSRVIQNNNYQTKYPLIWNLTKHSINAEMISQESRQ